MDDDSFVNRIAKTTTTERTDSCLLTFRIYDQTIFFSFIFFISN